MRADALTELAAGLPDGAALQERIAGPFQRALRVHPRRGEPQAWGALAAVPWSPLGRFHDPECDPGGMLDYHTGCIYPQDAASQLPVVLLAPKPGEVVLDACAAPGSKSTQIGLALGDAGLLICCDQAAPRRRILRENLQRQGIACALVTPLPLERLGADLQADAVLVDAPCSGHARRSPKQVLRMAARQASILEQAARLLRPGGRLVYSTCTPYEAENEFQVQAFLRRHEDFSREAVTVPGCDPDLHQAGGVRLWPQRQGTEPFFACLLRRQGHGTARAPAGVLPTAWSGLDSELPSALHCWEKDGRIFAATPAAASCAMPAEARGLLLGNLRDGSLQLHPWAAQALIERGAAAKAISYEQACRLWEGDNGDVIPKGFLRTDAGAPLGISDGQRLLLPSRLRRALR